MTAEPESPGGTLPALGPVSPPPGRRSTLAPTLALLAVTVAWGSTFVVVRDAVARMPVLDFLAVRFAVATGCLLGLLSLVSLLTGRSPRRGRWWVAVRLPRAGWRHGALLGVVLGAGYLGQTYGLQHTSAAVSGFVTGMFVVFTPLIAALVLRRPVPPVAWAAVALATLGLGLLSLRGLAVGLGEALTLLCALFFAVHIVGLGEWSPRYDAGSLAVVQLATVAALCTLAALPGGLTPPPDRATWAAVLLTAGLATAFAFVAQTWAQARLSPTRAAVVMTMEPVFAGLFAALAGERLGARTLLGGALVLAAMYLVEVGARGGAEGAVERLEA